MKMMVHNLLKTKSSRKNMHFNKLIFQVTRYTDL
uniref:Uncharacterized protein n=1 Tax=Arundo donax TaxID=35708 RepID=A0A0A9FK79_ARUDO